MSTDRPTGSVLPDRLTLSGPTMGSRWSAVFYAPHSFDVAGLRFDLQAAVDRVDDQMSIWKAASDLNRLNAAPLGRWVDLPAELVTVLEAAVAIEGASEGAFDIGVGDLVAAWGFGPPNAGADPGAARMTTLRTLELDLANRQARKHAPLRLDLSGIAKGFGVDELGRVLDAAGIGAWLAGIDGELRARGTKPDGRPWAVAHERPRAGVREAAGILELVDCAVATSGDYRHFRDTAEGRVSHTIDPRRNAPAVSDLVSVTVIAGRCMDADAWATAILVSGSSAGAALARRFGFRVLAIDRDGETSWLGVFN